ncbi:NrtR DNA-binding winged helix domain-containing protein [Corynebacterium sp.]|uniref:NUDIX hydrolase n=1 Tax=Corynebacterium sp. TaxID=1720 RepID=UPI002A915CEF|nr:NUDIX hydrolase [Corynebacterium sp.]MDY5784613.1 NUDIX hydrolase [Corynebacterium sp.]
MGGWNRLNVEERRQQAPQVAVSTVAFSATPPHGSPASRETLWVPLVRRVRAPFKGAWALPGGPTQWNQTLGQTARETLIAAAHAEPNYLEQLHAFGSVERSAQAERTVTIAYWAQYRARDFDGVPENKDPNIAWWGVNELPELAFDHAEIIQAGIQRLRRRAEQTLVAHRFLDDEFTMAELRAVSELIVGERLDPANFRRQALARGELEETGATQAGTKHRPAKYYRFTSTEQD